MWYIERRNAFDFQRRDWEFAKSGAGQDSQGYLKQGTLEPPSTTANNAQDISTPGHTW